MASPAKLPFNKLFPLIHAAQLSNPLDRDFLYNIVRWLIEEGPRLQVTCMEDIYPLATHEKIVRHMYKYIGSSPAKLDAMLHLLYDILGIQDECEENEYRNHETEEEPELEVEPEANPEAELEDEEDTADNTAEEDYEDTDEETDEDGDGEDYEDTDYEDTDDEEEDEMMHVCLTTLTTLRHVRDIQARQTRHMGWMVGMLCVSVTASLLALSKCYQQDMWHAWTALTAIYQKT